MAEVRFRVHAADLALAVGVVAVVRPRALLVVVDGQRATVYASEGSCAAAAPLVVHSDGGCGAFAVPIERAMLVKQLDGPIDVAACVGPTPTVRIAGHEFGTVSPSAVELSWRHPPKPVKRVPAGVLAHGIEAVMDSVATVRRRTEEPDCIQLFDASTPRGEKGNGTLYATDRVGAAYFESVTLRDAPLAVPKDAVGPLLAWLKSTGGGLVGLASTEGGWTYLSNESDQVFGFVPPITRYERFAYYARRGDGHILRACKEDLVRALRFVQESIDKRNPRVTLMYRHAPRTLQIIAANGFDRVHSPLVRVLPIEEAETGAGSLGLNTDLVVQASVTDLLDLVSPLRLHHAVLRVALFETGDKKMPLLRTIESLYIDERGRASAAPTRSGRSYQCQVTRYRPGLPLPK